ncbi:MAG: hypothetical protein Q4A97_02000 [Comamonadaceae bacterium]|nr:hypothetical protein [Comamonadaceae bacterium]
MTVELLVVDENWAVSALAARSLETDFQIVPNNTNAYSHLYFFSPSLRKPSGSCWAAPGRPACQNGGAHQNCY